MTQESNFYHAGMWDGVMSTIESIWNLSPDGTLYEYTKKVAPNILGRESEEFLKGYFPDEYPPEPKESDPFYHLTADWIDECVRAKFPFLAEHPEIAIRSVENGGSSFHFTAVITKEGEEFWGYIFVDSNHPWDGLTGGDLLDALVGFPSPVCYEAVDAGSWVGIFGGRNCSYVDMERQLDYLCQRAYEARSK